MENHSPGDFPVGPRTLIELRVKQSFAGMWLSVVYGVDLDPLAVELCRLAYGLKL